MQLSEQLRKDLSPKAVRKAVLSTATQKPLTVYAAAAAFLGSGFALMIEASPIVLSVVGVGAALSAANWAWEYLVKGDKHANDFVTRYRKELEARRNQALKELTTELSQIDHTQGIDQIRLFKEKYDSFVGVLDKKLNPEELTYNRYLSIAEQVFLAGLDNLEKAAIAINSVSAIDVDAIKSKLSAAQASNDSKVKSEELNKRLLLSEKQHALASSLLIENEKALTQLDLVSTKIANINTQQGRAQLDLEDAMTELAHLIDRAEKYSN